MDEEREGYRCFKEQPVIYAGPYKRKQCDEPPKATIRTSPENLEPELPDDLRDDVNAIRRSQIFGWFKHRVVYYRDTIEVICPIQDIVNLYNYTHKRQVSYAALEYALKKAGYIIGIRRYWRDQSVDACSVEIHLQLDELDDLRSIFDIRNEMYTPPGLPPVLEMHLKQNPAISTE